MPAFPLLDPFTVLLVAVIVLAVLYLVVRALQRRWRMFREQRRSIVTLFWNGGTWLLFRADYRQIRQEVLPEGRYLVERVQYRMLNALPIAEDQRKDAELYLTDALKRTLFENPNLAKFFTPEVQAEMRQRRDRSRTR